MLVKFQIFLDVMGLVQGVILGILLMVKSKKKNKSSFFLGLFVLFFSLELVHFIGRSLVLNGYYPELILLPFNFSWLLFPLFLIYTYKISVFSNRRPPYWTLVPGFLLIILQIHIFFLPYEMKQSIAAHPYHDFFHTYLGILYSWAIAMWNLKILYQHRIQVRNSFSHIEAKGLQWARIFLVYSLISSLLIHVLYLISPTNTYFKILFSIFDLFTIYWTAVHGISQHNVASILDNQDANIGFNVRLANETRAKPVSNVIIQKLMAKIDEYVNTSMAYTNTDFTIIDLAENLGMHPKSVSTAINTVGKQNFNSYINKFRIDKALELLESKELQKYSMEGIGTEVGFNSKSAFYSAFKKVTGTTPIKYKEQSAA